jgi:DNA-binding LytR/AlgR family response regulator
MKSTLRVLIAEDEMIISAKISMYLEEFGYEVAGALTRGEQVLDMCRHDPPDILLLDINLKGELDGIQTAEELKNFAKIPIIYLTANSDSATFDRARRTKPLAFVTKPFQKAELERALALVAEQLGSSTSDLDSAEGSNPSEETDRIMKDRIFLRDRNLMVKVMLSDILFVKAERAYCRVYTDTNRYTLSMALGKLENQLPPKQFMRVHRSHLVNIEHVNVCTDSGVELGEYEIPVSKAYRDQLLARLNLIG